MLYCTKYTNPVESMQRQSSESLCLTSRWPLDVWAGSSSSLDPACKQQLQIDRLLICSRSHVVSAEPVWLFLEILQLTLRSGKKSSLHMIFRLFNFRETRPSDRDVQEVSALWWPHGGIAVATLNLWKSDLDTLPHWPETFLILL